ncbi:K(+)/H(+) antiporter [Blyttiomyces sp. JEL0837]|nr:K(+)/H(+) antiporter [Blyttiomyces sp. JEL0837]
MTNIETGFISTNQAFQADGLARLLLQVVVILLVCRAISVPFKYLNQPRVIAEVIGGILLGPSALGRWTWFNQTVFPVKSLAPLNLLANFGLIMFLLLMGLELDLSGVVKRLKTSLSISFTGICVTFLISIGVSRFFYLNIPGMAETVDYPKLLIFIGVAMSVTALPVLARILTERKLLKTSVGITVLSAAAVDDAVGWTALALVIALIAAASPLTGLYILLTSIGFALFMFLVVSRVIAKIYHYLSSLHNQNANRESETLSQPMVIVAFLVTLMASFFTSAIGIHGIFGAFLTGLILPRENGFAHKFTEKIEELVSVVLLPLYFTYSGLKTNIGAVNSGTSFLSLFLVLLGCFTGKIGGCTLAARANGLNWRESFAVGVLMDTKGLVEIIILNIGLEAKLINDQVFAIMILLAIITTCITTPLVTVIYPEWYHSPSPERLASEKATDLATQLEEPTRLLLCLPSSSSVASMMSVVHHLSGSAGRRSPITGGPWISLHAARLRRLTDRISALIMAASQTDSDPALSAFQMFGRLRGLPVAPHVVLSEAKDYAKEISRLANETQSDTIVVPWRHADGYLRNGPTAHVVDSPQPPMGAVPNIELESSSTSSLSAIFSAVPGHPHTSSGHPRAHSDIPHTGHGGVSASPRVSWFGPHHPEASNVPSFSGFQLIDDALLRERDATVAAAAARESLVAEMAVQLMRRAPTQVAILVDRAEISSSSAFPDPPAHSSLLVPFFGGPDDRAALLMALRLATLPGSVVTILHIRHLYRESQPTSVVHEEEVVVEDNTGNEKAESRKSVLNRPRGGGATSLTVPAPAPPPAAASVVPAVTRLRRRFFPGVGNPDAAISAASATTQTSEEDAHPALPGGYKVDPVDPEDSRLLNLVLTSSGPIMEVPIPALATSPNTADGADEINAANPASPAVGSGPMSPLASPNPNSASGLNLAGLGGVASPVTIAPPPNSIPFRRVATASSIIHDDYVAEEISASQQTIGSPVAANASNNNLAQATTGLNTSGSINNLTHLSHSASLGNMNQGATTGGAATTAGSNITSLRRGSAIDIGGSPFVRTATATSQNTVGGIPAGAPPSYTPASPGSGLHAPSTSLPRPTIHLTEVAAVDPLLALCQAMDDPSIKNVFSLVVMGRFGPHWTARVDEYVSGNGKEKENGMTMDTRGVSTLLAGLTFPWGGMTGNAGGSEHVHVSGAGVPHGGGNNVEGDRNSETGVANGNTVNSISSIMRGASGENLNLNAGGGGGGVASVEEKMLGHAAAAVLKSGIGNANLMVVRKIAIDNKLKQI